MDYGTELTEQELIVLGSVERGFPVSWAPYCDIGEEIGQPEIEVLNTVLQLRMTGHIPRIGAEFADSFAPTDAADTALMSLLGDIPNSEHPFNEIHERLATMGVDQSPEWVVDRVKAWIANGSITSFGIQSV